MRISAADYPNIDRYLNIQGRIGLSFGEQIKLLSGRFLGCPYSAAPLKGSTQIHEELVVSFESFDCVTYVETVLALALVETPEQFLSELINIRYLNGEVDWFSRNHYMVDWVERNEARGLLYNLTQSISHITVERTLSSLANYPTQQRALSYIPVPEFLTHASEVQAGDILCFGTTTDNLDVRHLGFIFPGEFPGDLILRHAAKAKSGVVDESLQEFLLRFGECPGVWWLRAII